LLLDEVTSALDGDNELNVCSLLRSISEQKLVVVVSHSEVLASYAHSIVKFEKENV
jgi:ABC-type lipoprotein export system ATPase subunit